MGDPVPKLLYLCKSYPGKNPKCVVLCCLCRRAPKLLYLCKSYPEKILSVLRCVAFAAGVQVPRVPKLLYLCRESGA